MDQVLAEDVVAQVDEQEVVLPPAQVRLTEEGQARYALTIAKSGCVVSSTTDQSRAPSFEGKVQNAVTEFYRRLELKRKTSYKVDFVEPTRQN